jgi:uncharacterized Ntn-hydrolase superfamily protein
MYFDPTTLHSTYSIVAYDAEANQFGGAVQTHQMGVGRIIPRALAGFGVIASQALANRAFSDTALTMMQQGFTAENIIAALVASDPGADQRQVAVVDSEGRAAAHTGANCIRFAAHHVGEGYSVQANMMTKDTVIPEMVDAFEGASGDLAVRMLAAMQAAQAEDGDIRGMQSAALMVVPGEKGVPDWYAPYDLRVDEHENPVAELARLVNIRAAQLHDGKARRFLFEEGDKETALRIFAEAREMAPDQEEVAFWQAITLLDGPADTENAVAILRPVLANDPRREHWLDLVRRLEECGLIEREGAAEELLNAMNADS